MSFVHANAYESRGVLMDGSILVGLYRAPEGNQPLGAVAFYLPQEGSPLPEPEEPLSDEVQAVADGLFFGASTRAGLCRMEFEPGPERDAYSRAVDRMIESGPDRTCAIAAAPLPGFVEVHLFTDAPELGEPEEALVRIAYATSRAEWASWRKLALKIRVHPLTPRLRGRSRS